MWGEIFARSDDGIEVDDGDPKGQKHRHTVCDILDFAGSLLSGLEEVERKER